MLAPVRSPGTSEGARDNYEGAKHPEYDPWSFYLSQVLDRPSWQKESGARPAVLALRTAGQYPQGLRDLEL